MRDSRGQILLPGDLVAYATTTRPGRSTHAILRIGTIKKIATGKSGEYVSVQVVDDGWVTTTPVRESEKLVRLERSK